MKDKQWTFKTLTWAKELKLEREEEFREREKKAAIKKIEDEANAVREKEKERQMREDMDREYAEKQAKRAAEEEKLRTLQEDNMRRSQENMANLDTASKCGSQRSRRSGSSTRLSTAGQLALDSGLPR